jgi:hypothetical protein
VVLRCSVIAPEKPAGQLSVRVSGVPGRDSGAPAAGSGAPACVSVVLGGAMHAGAQALVSEGVQAV